MSACSCRTYCGDIPEEQDSDDAVCKGLRPEPSPPLVEVVMVHRDEIKPPTDTGESE